jgi:integral membrane sensor domain MASE1
MRNSIILDCKAIYNKIWTDLVEKQKIKDWRRLVVFVALLEPVQLAVAPQKCKEKKPSNCNHP